MAYLTEGRDHFTQVTADLDALGKSPVPDGDEVRAHMRSTVAELAGTLGEYARNAAVFPAPEFGAPYRLGLVEVASWTYGSPSLDDLAKKNAQVAEATNQATNC